MCTFKYKSTVYIDIMYTSHILHFLLQFNKYIHEVKAVEHFCDVKIVLISKPLDFCQPKHEGTIDRRCK